MTFLLDVLQNIYNGHRSPVLPVHITAEDGEEVKARTRFRLTIKKLSKLRNIGKPTEQHFAELLKEHIGYEMK